MKTNNNIPAYRFQGYTDAWELRKLGDEVYFYNGRAYKQSELLDFGKYKVVRVGNFNTNEKWYYSNLELEDSKTIDTGDLIYLWATSFGPEIWKGSKSIYHYHIWKLIIQQVEKIDKNYLYMWLYQDKKKIAQNTNGSTMVHITKKMIESRDFMFPSLPEQKSIGTFFSTLDSQITLHQRKLDMLKEQKKTYLKLLFPAKGQTKPALRFQGFEDDWEVKRISDIGDIVTGNTPSTSNEDYYSNEGMMWVTPTDIDGLIITDTNKKLSPEGEKVSRIVPANSILVTCIASIGKNTLLLEAGSFNQQINAVVPNQSLYHSYFLLTQSYFWSESMKRFAPAATMQIINKNEFSNITVPLPTLPEQSAIGTFFQTLDQEIAQVEAKLASLKEMKKTLLRKLFVS